VAAVGLVVVGAMDSGAAVTTVGLAAGLLGLGFGVHQAAVYTLTLRKTGPPHAGAASATMAVTQTVGTVTSIAVMTSLLAWQQTPGAGVNEDGGFLTAFRPVMLIAAAVTAAGGLVVASPLAMRLRARWHSAPSTQAGPE
jgi:hypothetical protein